MAAAKSTTDQVLKAVFPHAQDSWMWTAAYELGALFGLPRTLKYLSRPEFEEKATVAALQIVMHDSYRYATFALAFPPALLVGTAAIIMLLQWVCSGCKYEPRCSYPWISAQGGNTMLWSSR